jgi:hypothetical protein
MVLEVCNDLVYDLNGSMSLSLRVANLLWVTAALLDEVVTALMLEAFHKHW